MQHLALLPLLSALDPFQQVLLLQEMMACSKRKSLVTHISRRSDIDECS